MSTTYITGEDILQGDVVRTGSGKAEWTVTHVFTAEMIITSPAGRQRSLQYSDTHALTLLRRLPAERIPADL